MNLEKKVRPEGLDYFLASLTPIFIIGMICSIVYFLITVCYQGSYTGRLMWILGLYTLASVLVARIAIEQNRTLAFSYMLVLGISTLIAASRFFVATGPMALFSFPILMALLVIVAILADRITFDCALMNEKTQSAGVGLLQSLGLVRSERGNQRPKSEGKPRALASPRKHNPGIWVLYFSLIALPIFGLGQLFIRDDVDRRFAFYCLFVYLLSSLCLLVLIALLSLRKYLRERGVPMELSFAMRWLAIGMVSVFLMLVVLSFLPLPSKSMLSMELPFQISSRDDLQANRWGWGAEGVDGDLTQQGEQPQGERQQGEQQQGEQQQGEQQQGEQQQGEPKAKEANNANQDPQGERQGRDLQQGESKGRQDQESREQREKADRKSKVDPQPPQRDEPQQRAADQVQPALSLSVEWNIAASLQWLVLLALAIAAIVLGIVYRRQLGESLALFLAWLNGVRGRKKTSSIRVVPEGATLIENPYPPFDSFEDPFMSGNRWTREQIVRHMYRATLSWGYEHRVVRREDETPEEFVRRLARRFPEQQDSISLLGILYNRIAYARGTVAPDEIKPMAELWRWLSSGVLST
jgi:hypothetical protein